MTEPTTCPNCGRAMPPPARTGRPRKWCSDGCAKGAFAKRLLAKRIEANKSFFKDGRGIALKISADHRSP